MLFITFFVFTVNDLNILLATVSRNKSYKIIHMISNIKFQLIMDS